MKNWVTTGRKVHRRAGTCYEITLAERPERAYWLKETLYD